MQKKHCLTRFLLLGFLLFNFSSQATLPHFYDTQLSGQALKTETIANQLKNQFNNNASETLLKQSLSALIKHWRQLAVFQFPAEADEQFYDLVVQLDYFPNNENMTKELETIINSKQNLQDSFYKNSHKSINALAYLLAKKNKNKRIKNMINTVLKHITAQLKQIRQIYQNNRLTLLSDEKKFIAWLINDLSRSIYQLNRWRLTDDKAQHEYPFSGDSQLAITAIFNAHLIALTAMQKQTSTQVIDAEITEAMAKINQAIILNQTITNADKQKELQDISKQLTKLYHNTMTRRLGFVQTLLESDGD